MDLDKALGTQLKDIPVAWNQRDILLYAVGIGAKRDELQLLDEGSPDWYPFPTYPLVLDLKGDHTDISPFTIMKNAAGIAPGLPKMDPKKMVHAEQSISVHRPIPAVSGKGWRITKKVVGIKDTGKGLIVDEEESLIGPDGSEYASMVSSAYCFGKFNANGFNKSLPRKQPAKGLGKPPQRKPDLQICEKTTAEQAVMYRLSGDFNPLHVRPQLGKDMGFPGAILHGLCSYGHAARAIVKTAGAGNPQSLKFMSARFTSPVMPGDELETSIWIRSKTGREVIVDFVQKVSGAEKTCLAGGVAVLAVSSLAESKL